MNAAPSAVFKWSTRVLAADLRFTMVPLAPTRELVTRGGSWVPPAPFMGTHLKVLEALGDGGPDRRDHVVWAFMPDRVAPYT